MQVQEQVAGRQKGVRRQLQLAEAHNLVRLNLQLLYIEPELSLSGSCPFLKLHMEPGEADFEPCLMQRVRTPY